MKTIARLILFVVLLVVMVKVLESDFDKTTSSDKAIVAVKK